MYRFRWVILCLSAFVAVAVSAGFGPPEDSFLQQVAAQLRKFYEARYPEKSYLHLDKPVYALGETMWFKAYVVDATRHLPDTLSRVLYVDLLSPQNRLVSQRVLNVRQGVAHGDFILEDTLAQGVYTVRAYTSWMRNTSSEYFFSRRIPVWRTDPTAVAATPTTRRKKAALDAAAPPAQTQQPMVQFFPEGGTLIAQIDNRIAFKATDVYGHGVEVTGVVRDEQGAEVLAFQSQHLGMGNFLLNPAAGKHYQARVKLPDGTVAMYPLPVAQPEGLSLNVVEIGDNFNVVIRRRRLSGVPPESITLIGHVRGALGYAGRGRIDDSRAFTARVPKSKFPAGIVHFTLFDGQNVAQCERLAFVHREPSLQVKITPSKASYAPREKVDLALEVRDASGQPVAGQFSLSVNSTQALTANTDAHNILSDLLLTSDLQGYVENPAYYFQANTPDAKTALDNLLLTQGWRRFVWKQLLANTFEPSPFPLERTLSISGQVLNNNKRPIANADVALILTSPDRGFGNATTDADGRFLFTDLNGRDTTRAMVQAKGTKGNRNPILRLVEPLASPPTTPLPRLVSPQPEISEYLQTSKKQQAAERRFRLDTSKTIMLGNVTVKGRKLPPPDPRKIYSSIDATTIKLRDIPGSESYLNVLQVLQGRVPGLTINGTGFDMNAQIRGQGSPLFLLDGVTVDESYITSIPPADVESVDVLKGAAAAMYGGRGGGGVIAVYTKRGNPTYDYSKDPVPPRLAYVNRPGFYRAREFYVPQYDGSPKAPTRPDFRSTTLYWNPSVTIDASGAARLSFYCSDASGSFQVSGEGLSVSGMPGLGASTFTVK